METRSNPFHLTLLYTVYAITFFFPLFFLPITREFVLYTKYYFLIIGAVVLIVVSFIKFLVTRKFHWAQHIGVQALILIGLAYMLSVVLMSPNKIQALFNPQYGLVMIASLCIFYLYASYQFYKSEIRPALLVAVSSLFVSLISLFALVEPLRALNLPAYWTFLKNPAFNTVGTSINLLSFLIFSLGATCAYLWRVKNEHSAKDNRNLVIVLGVISLFVLLSVIFTIYTIVDSLMFKGAQVVLPPFNLSWYAAIEVLKSPMTAIFGVGVDNFSALYPQVRTVEYNSSELWQINTFAVSRSALLHTLTEVGVLGLTGFGLLIMHFSKLLGKVNLESKVMFVLAVATLVLLPVSIVSYFMFFLSLAAVASDIKRHAKVDEYEIDLTNLTPIYVGMVALYVLAIGGTGYYLWNNFVSEFYYKKSLDAVQMNDLNKLYQYQAKAVQYNLYNEDFRRNFSQTNLLLANNIAAKQADQITDNDRQIIAQAIQAAIQEGKAGVFLNSQKVTNWQNLASIYRQIINVAENAPAWTIQTYQQAMMRDPRNPVLRLDLGGIYYLFGSYGDAQRLFEQAVALKPDWANAHYNLGWAYFQQKQYAGAVEQMQIVVSLIDPSKQEADFKRAQKDLDDFKVKLVELQQQQAREQAAQQQRTTQVQETDQLNLPTPPAAVVEPKIELPKDASPEAR